MSIFMRMRALKRRAYPSETWDEVAQTWRKVLSLPQVRSVVLELSTQRELSRPSIFSWKTGMSGKVTSERCYFS